MRRAEDELTSSVDPELEARVAQRRVASGYWEAARRALAFARRYRFEEGPRGEREKACVTQALAYRRAAHEALATSAAPRGPGLAQARGGGSATASKRAG